MMKRTRERIMAVEIIIQTIDGNVNVDAVIIGEYAVHKSYGVHSDLWTLTHVSSGLSFYRGFPSPSLAYNCARELGSVSFKKPILIGENVTHANKREYITAKNEKLMKDIHDKYRDMSLERGGGE